MPSFRIMSIPRKEACMPAESPSYITVMLRVKRCSNCICSVVSEVPDEATTFSTPDWCIEITSV